MAAIGVVGMGPVHQGMPPPNLWNTVEGVLCDVVLGKGRFDW